MNPNYEDEERIVWLKDRESLEKMGYVRESVLLCRIRTGPLKAPPGEMLIGYAILKKTSAKSDQLGYCRRIFTLKPVDLVRDTSGNLQEPAPPEAVDPLSVQAGKASKRLEKRAEG